MNLASIKAKLEALNNPSSSQDRVDNSKSFWKPAKGVHTVRVIPSKYNPDDPFTEMRFHYGIGKFPMVALSTFGKQDPIEDFVAHLKKEGGSDNWKLANKLSPKPRVFVPVIVRGEEELGVRLWGVGKTVYQALLSLAADDEIGDFTNLQTGYDLKVEVKQQENKDYPDTLVTLKPKLKPASDDKKLLQLWMEEQPEPLKCYEEKSYEFIKVQLENHLTGGAVEPQKDTQPVKTTAVDDTDELPWEKKEQDTQAVDNTKTTSKTSFEDLFK